jgi:hypothetical protein
MSSGFWPRPNLKSLRQYAAVFIILVGLGIPVRAADVSCVLDRNVQPSADDFFSDIAPPCFFGLIRGVIVRGDYEKVLGFYTSNHPSLFGFFLFSSGGDVEDAIKIGRLLRKYLIIADAPRRGPDGRFALNALDASGSTLCRGSKCICASACALIWFGAVNRIGTVGLHRPRINDPAFKALAPSEASAVYRRMLDSISRYLDEMEVPKPLIDSMVATGSAEIEWVDSNRAFKHPPSFAEWVDASCGPFTYQESDTMSEITSKKRSSRSQQEEILLESLRDKWDKKFDCEMHLIDTQRRRLSPP